jgi:hypothetical protein
MVFWESKHIIAFFMNSHGYDHSRCLYIQLNISSRIYRMTAGSHGPIHDNFFFKRARPEAQDVQV